MAGTSTTPTKVQFPEDISDKPNLKHVPTQKYDRKEISKRMEIESWMEGQLKELFETEDYPQLDIDDVLEIKESEREQRLREYLKPSKKPYENFIQDLLKKAATVKPVPHSVRHNILRHSSD